MVLLIANVNTAYSGLFLWPGLKEWWERIPWQRQSLHLVTFRQSTANKECYSSVPKGPSVQTRPTQHRTALKGCSTILHLVECFCSGHWHLTLSTSDAISHLFPNENHIKSWGLGVSLRKISKQLKQTQQNQPATKPNQATLTELHHCCQCSQQLPPAPLLPLMLRPGGLTPKPETTLAQEVKSQMAKQGTTWTQVSTPKFLLPSLSQNIRFLLVTLALWYSLPQTAFGPD